MAHCCIFGTVENLKILNFFFTVFFFFFKFRLTLQFANRIDVTDGKNGKDIWCESEIFVTHHRATMQMSGNKDVSAFPDGDNLFSWIGTIKAANGTVFEGATYKLSLKFPQNYPYSPPTVKFETACFHPNVDVHGNICLDILKEEWSAIYNVSTILISIQSLLGEPNNNSPLNPYAAQIWDNTVEYREVLLSKNAEAFAATQ